MQVILKVWCTRFPQESKISGLGVANEHINSTRLGLKGNPALAEALQVSRDLFLLEYTEGKLTHTDNIHGKIRRINQSGKS